MEGENEDGFEKSNFTPQKENVYNKLLPYKEKLDEESNKLFFDIKTNLIKSVLAREIRPGCALWTSRLNKYIKIYGLKFSKQDHIDLIKLFYELLIIPNLDPVRINKFAVTLTQLLKKRYLLSQDDLQLEWRPLYELCVQVMEKNKTELGMYKYFTFFEQNIENLIRYAKVYFPTKVTQEILDEFRPRLCPSNNSEISSAIEYLELFLPLHVNPEDAHIGYNLWFEELMTLWEVCHNANIWENHITWLMARLSSKNLGYINWEPYIPVMFSRFLRNFNLPVSYRQKTSSKTHKIDVSAMALWIVCALNGDNNSAFFHLEKFMQTIETYLHPANSGRWTLKLLDFLRRLSFHFVQRVHCERERKPSWELPVPDHYKLTDEDIDRFVNVLKPCMQQAIFSRGSNDASFAFQYIASIRPNIIIPIILEKLYASMDNLTEPHKYTSSMMCLKAVTRYMVQGKKYNYPEGPTQVIPILLSLLPGIDPNDIRKCFVTLNLMIHIINVVPIVDSSLASKYYDDLTEEEHLICEASASFEDFVLQLFDKLCVWVESNSLEFVRMEQSDNDRTNKFESLGENMIYSIIYALLSQCSDEIFMAALKKMYNFVQSRIFEPKVSGKLIAVACQAFCRVNPVEVMKMFVPYLCDNLEVLLTEDVIKEEHVDNELIYNLLILSEMIDGRDELVNYIDRICKILDKTLHMKSVQGSQMAARMLNLIMYSLTYIQPVEFRSCNKSYNLPINEFLTIREWGEPGNLHNLNINWYVPKEREISCVEHLLQKYLLPEIDTLNKYSNGEIMLSREELRKSLKIIISLLGCHPLLPLWKEPTYQLVDSVLEPWEFELIVGTTHNIKMPDGKNIRKIIVDTINEVQRKILKTDEGDTKSISSIIQIYDTILFHKFRCRDFQSRWKSFHALKKVTEDRLRQNKKHLRQILIDRVQLHQEFRCESRCCYFTITHKQILLNLFELGVSRYSEIRSAAQQQLFNAISTFPYSYTVLVPRIKEILQLDPTEHHETFKGCLYILLGPKGAPIATRHSWSYIKDIWPLIIKSKPSEKPTIINLMNILVDSIHRQFPTISIMLEIPDRCLQFTNAIAKNIPAVHSEEFKKVIDHSPERLRLICDEKKNFYNKTVNILLESASNGTLHWRHQCMALSFIRELVHPDVKYNHKVIKFFLNSLINESINIRKIALRVTLFILIQNKPKFKKVTIDPYKISNIEKINNEFLPGIRDDNKWMLYNYETAPKTNDEWEKNYFIHNSFTGFYCWPKKVETYAPPGEQITPAKRLQNLTPEETEIYLFFKDVHNVELLIKYFSLEEKKGKDLFNPFRFLLYKNLFKMFEDDFLDVYIPHLKKLVEDKQEQSQICACEIISGLIRGSKHWSFEKVTDLWNTLIPIFRTAFSKMSEETISDWMVCVTMSLESRDPNRHYRFLEFLMDDPLSEQTSFIGCSRIVLLQQALNQQPWRNLQLIQRLLKYFENHLYHPFQNVRDKISNCLTILLNQDVKFSKGDVNCYPKVTEFFAHVLPKLNVLYNKTIAKLGHSPESFRDIGDTETDKHVLNDIEQEQFIRLFKTVAKFVTTSVMQVNYSPAPEFYKLMPLACILQSNDVDDELETTRTCLLAALAHSLIPNKFIPSVIDILANIAICPFWNARATLAEFIQVFVFHNMATIVNNKDWVLKIQNLVLLLLEDIRPEVRNKASHVLSDFLHCRFISNPDGLLTIFKHNAKTKIKKRRGIELENTQDNSSAIKIRHAGVLGLCAFISSHPYNIPDYLPSIFSELSLHLNDPQPIPTSIRKTLGDFKRTHHDNWDYHKLQFTEEELSILSDLTVPPSYYA